MTWFYERSDVVYFVDAIMPAVISAADLEAWDATGMATTSVSLQLLPPAFYPLPPDKPHSLSGICEAEVGAHTRHQSVLCGLAVREKCVANPEQLRLVSRHLLSHPCVMQAGQAAERAVDRGCIPVGLAKR
jgi:hypothetical protein